jgi:hypothetical protein
MELTEQQAEVVQDYLAALGAKNALLNELTDHWCVLVNLEMAHRQSFEDAFASIQKSHASKAKLLVAEIQELRFPYVISPKLIAGIGIAAFLLLLIGIALQLSFPRLPKRLLLPGLLMTAYVFLPLWLLRKLYTTADKVWSVALFLNLFVLAHVTIVWIADLRIKFIAISCWAIFALFCVWYYLQRKQT